MSLKNFNVQNGLSVNDVQVVDSNANVIANALISNTFVSTNNSNITLNPNGTGVIDVSNKKISNLAEPEAPGDAATKRYVDGVAQGLNLHIPAQAGTPGLSLATITGGSVLYNNGTNGYNATLTLSVALTMLDGYTIQPQDRLLIKDESDQTTNGIYTIDPTFKILTRALDTDQTVELDGGDFVFVQSGNTLKATGWVQTTRVVVIGTNNIVWEQFSGTGAAATTVSANVGDITITGGTTDYVLAATNNSGGLHYANIANYFLVTSNISTVVAGSTLAFTVDYANASYPGGIYTLKQLGPVSLSISDQWSIGGSLVGTTKNAYANYVANTVNTANVSITVSLANAKFNIQSTDTLQIGSTTLTGTQLLGIYNLNGITPSNGYANATFTIPSTSLNASVQAGNLSTVNNTVLANLTNDRGTFGANINTASGTTLVSTAPIAYSLNSISGNFPSSSIPYWNLNQTFNWSVSTTGTTSAGNLTYSGGAISTTSLSSTGGASGTSGSIDSTSSYTITTSDYYGAGLNGYGNRTIPSTVNGTVNSATKYYPLFWKITNNNSLPSFAVSDSRNSNNYVTGQGATTSTTASNYLWLAITNSGNASPLASHTFKHVFGGFDIVDSPSVSGTQTITSSGQSYNYSIYGFSGFTTASFILTTS